MKRLLAFFMAAAMLVVFYLPAHAQTDIVAQWMEKMTLRDKVAQMMMVDFRFWDEVVPLKEDGKPDMDKQTPLTEMNPQVEEIIRDYNFGAVIYFIQNLAQTRQSYELAMDMQRAAVQDGGIPMLISVDQEGGNVYRLTSGTSLPGNMALAAAGDAEYARKAGEIIGSELSVLGINTNLAPVVDVNNNAGNPVIGLRSFGDDAERVGDLASAIIDGMRQYNVIGCVKHFPGHGDTETDSHYALPSVDKDLETLLECELAPYEIAIEQGVEMIMTAHILYPQLEDDTVLSAKTGKEEALPATLSDDIITGLLKGQMGFEGVVVTDALNMAGIVDVWGIDQAAILAIQAGVDMLCMPWCLHSPEEVEKLDAVIQAICNAVERGEIGMERIDDAVARILSMKENRGILDWNEQDYSLEAALQTVGNAQNRENERAIAAAAVTVVQNKNDVLPLKLTQDSRMLMLVPYENEKAQMIMGFNRAKSAGLIPDGAQLRVERFGKETLVDDISADIEWADIIVFNSEINRADKMNGGSWESAFIYSVIDIAEADGKTTVVQSVDKPYDVQSYPEADAVLAVYGCKGSGIDPTLALVGGITASQEACCPNIIAGVEVMLGVYGAQGRLPVGVPKFENGEYTQELAFERGFGLFYEGLMDAGLK